MATEMFQCLELLRRGKPDDALNSLKGILKKRIAKFNHTSAAEVQNLIANVLGQQGKFEEALYHAREAYKKYVLAYGFTDPDALDALSTIALIHFKQGRNDVALNILQEVYHHQCYLGYHPRKTLSTESNIASVLDKKGEDVLPIYEKIYNMLKELKDVCPNGSFTLLTRFNIADQLSNRGQYDEALEILKEVNAVHNRSINRSSLSFTCLDLTAKVLAYQGKIEDSLEIAEQSLKWKVELFGPDHPNTLETLKAYDETIIMFTNQKMIRDRLVFLKSVYDRRKNVLGPTHQATLNFQEKIARMLLDLGKGDEALSLCNDIYKIRSSLDPNSPHTLAARTNIGIVLTQQCKYDEAISIYKDINEFLKYLNPDHPYVLETRIRIANVLVSQGKYDEALKMYNEVSKIHRESSNFEPEHPQILAVRSNVATILKKRDKFDEALKIYTEVLDRAEKSKDIDPDDELIKNTRYHVAFTYIFQEKLTESLDAFEQLYVKELETNGVDHPAVLSALNNIAGVLVRQGKYAESLVLFQEVYKKRIFVLGRLHPDTLSSERSIRNIVHFISSFMNLNI